MSIFIPPSDPPQTSDSAIIEAANLEIEETPEAHLGAALAEAGPLPSPVNLHAEEFGAPDYIGAQNQARGARLKRLARPIVGFFGAQLVVQLLALLAGLLVVRTMSKTEYAFYTLANTSQGALTILTDLGAGSALMALGGKVWQDKTLLGQLLQTALSVRKLFQIVVSLLIGPTLLWLLRSHSCPWPAALVITAGIVASVYYQIGGMVYLVVPRLHAQLGVLQKIDLIGNGFRLLLLGLTFALGLIFFNATVVTLIGLVTFMVQAHLARRWASAHADLSQKPDAEQKTAIFGVVRQEAPVAIYYALQGQITVWVISLFGTTQTIAEVGALSRILMLLTVFSSLLSNVAAPRFARCQDVARLKQIYWGILAAVSALGALLLALSLLFPQLFLWLIGKQYANLGGELPFMVFAAATSLISGALTSLLAARAWINKFWLSIPIAVIAQIALLPFLNLGSVRDVILLGCLPSVATWGVYFYQAHLSFGQFAAEQKAV